MKKKPCTSSVKYRIATLEPNLKHAIKNDLFFPISKEKTLLCIEVLSRYILCARRDEELNLYSSSGLKSMSAHSLKLVFY